MKKITMLVFILLVAVAAVPVVSYKTLNPCTMLKKEYVNRAKERTGELTTRGKEKASEYGEDAERIVDGIGAVLENAAGGIVEGLAEAQIEELSLRECAREWWRVKFGDGD